MKTFFSPNSPTRQNVKRRQGNKTNLDDLKFKIFTILRRFVYLSILLSLLFMSWSLYRFVSLSNYFLIHKIAVNDTKYVSKDQIIVDSGILPRSNLVKVSTSDVEKKISRNPWIKSVQVIKYHPSSVYIRVFEREPVALIISSEIWGIDINGYLLPGLKLSENRQLPIITLNQKINSKQNNRIYTDEMKKTLFVITRMKQDNPDLFRNISEIDITKPENIVLYTMVEGTEIRLGNENLSDRLSKLYKFWKMAEEKQIVHEYVDLRFDNQGIVTKPKIIHKRKQTVQISNSA